MIDAENIIDQPIMSYIKSHENIRKITNGQVDYYTCLPLALYDHLLTYLLTFISKKIIR